MNTKKIPLNERVIFALDVHTAEEAMAWVNRLQGYVAFYKVGLQLFLGGGFPVIEQIIDRGHKVMVDLKFFDIPETVKLAVAQVAAHNPTFITVHGNDPILRAAIEARKNSKILAVTVLTSFDQSDMTDLGMTGSIEDLVLKKAQRAVQLGCDGIVSSGLEAARMRHELGNNFLVVTPGIRPGLNIDTLGQDDQKRIVTAKMAIQNGADYVVIGRPISRADNPIAVVTSLHAEIAQAVKN